MQILCEVADSDKADVDDAVEAALKCVPQWSTTTRAGRSKVLHRLADLIEAKNDELGIYYIVVL